MFAEIYRVLRPGGRRGISDVVAESSLTAEQRASNSAECLDGARTVTDYLAVLRAAGLREATVTVTHEIGNGLHAAIIQATKAAT